MEGTLTKKGKYWYVVVYLGVDSNGKKNYKWHNTKCEDKKEAQKVQRSILTSIDKGTYVEPSKIAFGDFIQEWLEKDVKYTCEETTFEDYKRRADKYITPYFKNKPIQKLQPADIKDYYNWLQTEHKQSNNTIYRHQANIHKCLDYAWKEKGLIERNVSDAVSLPKKEKFKAQFYNAKQIELLLQAVKGTYIEIPVTITIAMGLRRGEVLGLKWENVNFDLGELYITTTRVRNKKVITKQPKTESSRRTLSIPDYLFKYLKQLHLKQKQNKEWKYGNTYCQEGWVCCKEDGSPIGVNYINEVLTKLLDYNGLPHIRFHDLRHSNASYLLKQGVTMKELQEWLGHTSMMTTADIYTHIDAEQKKSIAKKSNTMFKNVL